MSQRVAVDHPHGPSLLPKGADPDWQPAARAGQERLDVGKDPVIACLPEEMKWIFKAKRIHREALAALAALRLFREASAREQETVELAHRVVRYFYRVQHDPVLKFAA